MKIDAIVQELEDELQKAEKLKAEVVPRIKALKTTIKALKSLNVKIDPMKTPVKEWHCLTCGDQFTTYQGVSMHRHRLHPDEWAATRDTMNKEVYRKLQIEELTSDIGAAQ